MGLATAVLFTLAFVAVFLVITPAIKIARKIFESPKQPSQEPKKETSPTKDVSPAVEQQLSRTQRHDLASMRERVVDEYRLSGKVDIKELKKELDRKLGYAGLGDDFIQGLDRMSPDNRSAYFREGKDGSMRVFWNGSLLFQLKTDQSFSYLRILPPCFEGVTDAGMARTVMAAITAAGALAETAGARDVINRIEKIILCPDNIASIKRELIPEIVKADAKAIEKPDEELGERLDYARRRGISERFVEDSGNGPEINPKTISDSLAKGSGLTHIEVNNRRLAGKSFKGFNLLADDSNRISLSYAGQTVATFVRFEEEEPVEVNGKIEKRNISYFRTNTFPPKTSEDTLPSDITAMMEAAERIRTVDDDPNLVLQVMKDIFCEPDNIAALRSEIVPKIQEAEFKKTARELHPEDLGRKKGTELKL